MSYTYLPTAKRSSNYAQRSLWLTFTLLSLTLLLAFHWPLESASSLGEYNASSESLATGVETGSSIRQFALIALGIFSIVSILRNHGRKRLRMHGTTSWALAGFVAWAFLSCAWAEDRALTGKRLVVFGILCLLAIALVRLYSLREVRLFIVCTMTLFVATAVAMEFLSGSFHPLAGGYRFSGIQHPNAEGVDCGLLFLSALMTWKEERQWRWLTGSLATAGLVLLLLTASRTALGATLVAAITYLAATSSTTRKRKVLPVLAMLVCCVALFLGSGRSLGFKKAIALGREDGNDVESLTGRTIIWNDVGKYAIQRPMLGYGYEGFWTPQHIRVISEQEEWGVPDSHSTYVDYVLSLGFVGLSLYLLAFIAGLVRAFTCFRKTRNADFIFGASLLTFCLFSGFLESNLGYAALLMLLAFVFLVRLGYAAPDERIA